MAGVVYQAGKDGKAPSNAGVGDYVQTQGGTFQIVDGSKYQGLSADSLAKAGVGYNPESGLYSRKVNEGGVNTVADKYGPIDVQFDTNAWKQTYIDNMVGKLQASYDEDLANLSKAHNTNVSLYQDQASDVNAQYNQSVEELARNAYLNNVLSKQQMAKQGLTSSAQGIAMGQHVLNAANRDSTALYTSREETLNKIQRAINDLTSNFNIDKATLKKRLNADTLSIMSDGELAALNKELELLTFNVSNQNQWGMTQYQTEMSAAEAQKARDLQEYLTLMQLEHDDKWRAKELAAKYAGMKNVTDEDLLNADYELMKFNNYTDMIKQSNPSLAEDHKFMRFHGDVYADVAFGKITAGEAINKVKQTLSGMNEVDRNKKQNANLLESDFFTRSMGGW